MPLTLDQRRDRLRSRLAELDAWRVRARAPISGWTCDGAPIAVGAPWPEVEGVRRFAADAAAPEDWPLSETRLRLDAGGESLLTLTFEDGERESFGLDPNHDEFPVRERRFGIAVESVARSLFGQPVRAPALARAELVWLEVEVEALRRLLVGIVETVSTLPGDEAVPHLLEAGEAALRGLVWPSQTLDYVARLSTVRLQNIWKLPPLPADPPALSEEERTSVARAREGLTRRLKELQALYPPRGRIALSGHAHIDLAWLWPYDETRRKLRRTFHTALGLLERSPDFVFNQSTAAFYAQVEADDPALFQAIRARVAEGRWEPIGGMWVEPDTAMPSGESLVRQLLYGQLYFERVFGARSRVCWLPDCFGFSPVLPQLLRLAGIDSFCTTKVNWSETNRFPYDLFWWEGLDGSSVLAHVFDNPINGYNGEVRPDGTAPTWARFRQKDRHDETLLSVGHGDGGGGVTPEMVAREIDLRDFPALPRARWSRVDAFFERAHARAGETALPVWSGEMYLELHRATLTSQSGVKRRHRRAEQALVAAEALASLTCLLGGEAPASLEALWRPTLKNEFHDILPGSSIREVYVDAERELVEALAAAAERKAAALRALASLAPPGDGDGVLVVNPSLHGRALEGEIAGEGFVSTGETLAPLGVRILRPGALAPAPGLSLKGRMLENAHLRAELAEDGSLASLVHKASGREALAGRGNQLWVYAQDKPRNWDAWDVEEDYEASGEEIRSLDRLETAAEGPHYASLRVTRRWRHSTIVQEIGLSAAGRRLDIRTQIDWRDRRALLRSLTPAAVRARHAVAECAFGVIERPTHANTSWEAAMFEWAAHRFVDLGEPGFGLALLNDAKYGHSVRGNMLGLSLVRGPIYPDPLADEGEQSFAYALMPHAGAWHEADVREEAEALNQPLASLAVQGVTEWAIAPLRVEGLAVGLAGLKAAEDGEGLVLRVYEPAGARGPVKVTPPEGWRVAGAVDVLERPVEGGGEMRPFEVRGWRLVRA